LNTGAWKMREKTKKATFNLHTDVLDALDEAMSRGAAHSKNALVEKAIVEELNELRRRDRKELWQEAIKDPQFLKDIRNVEADFKHADGETAGRMDQ
jgi:hypothetical protein